MVVASKPPVYAFPRLSSDSAPPPKPPADESPQEKLERAIQFTSDNLPRALAPVQKAAEGLDFTQVENAAVGANLAALSKGVAEVGAKMHPLGTVEDMVGTWLGATPFHQFSERRMVAPLLPGLMTKAVNEVIKNDYKVRMVVGIDSDTGQLASPKAQQIQVDYDKKESLPSEAVWLLEDQKGNHLLVDLRGSLKVMSHTDQKDVADEFFTKVNSYAQEHNFYKNKILQYIETMQGAYLAFQDGIKDKKTTWNDISLKPEIKRLVQSNTVDFIHNLDTYKENGRFANRNLLLAGPPGTGKSMVNDVLFNELKGEVTFIHVTSKSLSGAGSVSGIFEAARMMQPAVLIFEDLDLVGSTDRNQNSKQGVLNEMLNQLSGVLDNTGLVILGSTNQATAFDEAMLRPLRFSTIVPIELPDQALRQQILENLCKHTQLAPDVNLAQEAERTPNFSGAGLTEYRELAIQHAIDTGSLDGQENVILRKADFDHAQHVIQLKQDYLDKLNHPSDDHPPQEAK